MCRGRSSRGRGSPATVPGGARHPRLANELSLRTQRPPHSAPGSGSGRWASFTRDGGGGLAVTALPRQERALPGEGVPPPAPGAHVCWPPRPRRVVPPARPVLSPPGPPSACGWDGAVAKAKGPPSLPDPSAQFSGKTPPSFRLASAASPSSSAGVSLRPGVGPSQPSLHHFAGLATARGLGRLRGRPLPAGQAGAGPGGLATQAWVGSGSRAEEPRSGSRVRTGTEDPMRGRVRSFSQPLGRLESPASELHSPPEPLPSCSLWIHHFLCLVCSLSFFTSFLFCNVTSLPSSSS